MIDTELVTNKLERIRGDILELRPLLEKESRDIINDNVRLRAVERLFQLVVDTAIDVNTHIIAESNFQTPDDYRSTFITLGEHKVLPPDFARKIAPSVGLRNLIVHQYGTVDLKLMVDHIKNEISDYDTYITLIHDYTERL